MKQGRKLEQMWRNPMRGAHTHTLALPSVLPFDSRGCRERETRRQRRLKPD